MVSRVSSFALKGVASTPVEVQVHIASGIPAFTIVGLPDKIVAESKERVRAALNSIGISLPAKRITINLAPADIVKEGSHFDLPIACGLLVGMGVISQDFIDQYAVMGELSLDGSLNAVPGVLPAAIDASEKSMGIICPVANGVEATWSGSDIEIIAAKDLVALINHAKGTSLIAPPQEGEIANDDNNLLDLIDVKGQYLAKRALEIAAAGGHNVLMSGPPGVGKSMLANRIVSILPPLSNKEILECSVVASVAGEIADGKLKSSRPFRAPHHSCSIAAMVGGGIGKRSRPGEVSMAHNGVLFLDELPEFPRSVLESLRQPIESGNILVARVNSHITYPANFQLIAAMNPCPCGHISDPSRCCNRAPKCAIDYQSKISGPILDRIDLFVELENITVDYLRETSNKGESSNVVLKRVARAREIQSNRYKNNQYKVNSRIDGDKLEEIANLGMDAKELLLQSVESMKLSMRGINRIIKVARTIADLEESLDVNRNHIAEALSYRLFSFR
jgi:magnesium chelatase family protein